jgi:hypothetical protein
MVHIRLIDLEGRTYDEMDWPDRRDMILIHAYNSRHLTKWQDPDVHGELEFTTIAFRRERQDGGGTWIYRRTTGPWG